MQNPALQIFGVPITPMSSSQLITAIDEAIRSRDQTLVFNVNAHCLNLAYTLPSFRGNLREADIVYVDGFGVVLAGNMLGTPIPIETRMTPPDWMDELATTCISQEYSMYFLGAKPGVAEKAAQALASRNPGLSIAGTHHGYFNKSHDLPENQEVIDDINKSEADILLVGFGMPLQESWIIENKGSLGTKVSSPLERYLIISPEKFAAARGY